MSPHISMTNGRAPESEKRRTVLETYQKQTTAQNVVFFPAIINNMVSVKNANIYLSIYQPVCLSVCPSVRLSVYNYENNM